jgi:hypothetical protein
MLVRWQQVLQSSVSHMAKYFVVSMKMFENCDTHQSSAAQRAVLYSSLLS